MTELLVIDASIAAKWVIEEENSTEALSLREGRTLIAPDLIATEYTNILWKKVRRGEISKEEALLAIQALAGGGVQLEPSYYHLATAVGIAIELDHAVYDCVYIALAIHRGAHFVTADQRLLNKLSEPRHHHIRIHVVGLQEFFAA